MMAGEDLMADLDVDPALAAAVLEIETHSAGEGTHLSKASPAATASASSGRCRAAATIAIIAPTASTRATWTP